ncbi:RagB/SusD family nutrient uptake outer membrane protein [Mucilaginibacter sp. MD40]|uniref:RagB/SusD family nutrient uptake outer membrane protein n=1 Tax=Mucilaginibacter sp. MD40 TaxID=2029590 RepID=UPI0018E9D37E|nr:RagB/SusD family nutrient uptake outer membrane protein [Mucilaginibacter sp. MD40]
MKNKYLNRLYIPLFLVLIWSTSACKKDNFLDVPPKGSLTDATTFSSESNADLFVNDIYNQLPDMNNEYQVLDQYTDNDFPGAAWMTGQTTVRANGINPSNVPGGPAGSFNWTTQYGNIRKCNVFLQQAAKNKANFSADWYNQRVAEVTFLRAFFYSILYTNYGGLPLITAPLNNADGTDIFVERSTADQTLAFIEADCDAAAAVLPAQASQSGRATKGAALTLKGWVELFAASPLSNPSNDAGRWAKAAATNLQVMNANTYSLFPDYGAQFLSSNNWNSETIFARGYAVPNKGHNREGTLGPVIVNGVQQAWGNLAPTQNLVDDYEMDNGKPISDPTSGYDPQNPYVGREKRFYQSIVYDGSIWQGDTWLSRTGGNNQIDLGSSSDISNTGYNAKKTLDESIKGQTSLGISPGTSNYIFYRYAEVLLSYAEAQNEAVGPDQSVYTAVNKVRARVSLPALPAGLSQADMRTIIRRERRIEFAFEDKRWYDIRRWDITTKGPAVLTSPEYGMQITIDPSTKKLIYTPVQIFKNSFSEYMNWLPIPQGVIEQNKKLKQNPGY